LNENFANLPVFTLEAPTTNIGRLSRGPQAAISPKSMYWRRRSGREVNVLRFPAVQKGIIIFSSGEAGVT